MGVEAKSISYPMNASPSRSISRLYVTYNSPSLSRRAVPLQRREFSVLSSSSASAYNLRIRTASGFLLLLSSDSSRICSMNHGSLQSMDATELGAAISSQATTVAVRPTRTIVRASFSIRKDNELQRLVEQWHRIRRLTAVSMYAWLLGEGESPFHVAPCLAHGSATPPYARLPIIWRRNPSILNAAYNMEGERAPRPQLDRAQSRFLYFSCERRRTGRVGRQAGHQRAGDRWKPGASVEAEWTREPQPEPGYTPQ